MRVLVTGMTKQHVGGGTQLKYEPVADLVAKGIKLLLHEVDHRRVTIGEDLSGYDAVVVGVVPPLSVATNYLHSALWTIWECDRRHIPLLFFVDDWQFPSIMSKLGTVSRDSNHLTKPFFAGRPDHQWAVENVEIEMTVVNWLLRANWPPTIIPAFTWGDHKVLTSRLPNAPATFVFDPSVLARSYAVTQPAPTERVRRWVLGTVSDQLKWLETVQGDWPVEHFGGRASKAPQGLSEADLVQMYAFSWGVMSPPYTAILGTGWWRNRLVYAARTHSVLLCDPREAPQLGDAYQLKTDWVEKLDDERLRELGDWQARELLSRQMAPGEIGEVLTRALEAARLRSL